MINRQPSVTLHPRRVAYFLGAIVIALAVAHLGSLFIRHIVGNDYAFGFVPFFDLGTEWNAPTFFSTCLILLNATLFICIWQAARIMGEKRKAWLFLSGLFFFLAFDEFFILHERLIDPVRSALGTSGFFYFAWVIPYGIAVILLAIFVIPVIWRSDRQARLWFCLSATAYIAGAIGLEMIGGNYFEAHGAQKDLIYRLFQGLEETLEMTGLVLLVYAQLVLIKNKYGGFLFAIPGSED